MERKKDLATWAHSRIPELQSMRSFVRFLLEKRIGFLIAFVTLILFFFFWDYIKAISVILLFVFLGSVSMIYNRWVKVSLGVEFVMLGLVITTLAFGRLEGLFVGMTGLFFAEVLAGRFTHSTFVSFIGIMVVGLIAPNVLQYTGSVTATGIVLTVIYDAVIIPGYLLLGSSPGRSALFVATHILFNAWVFSFIAPFIFRMVA